MTDKEELSIVAGVMISNSETSTARRSPLEPLRLSATNGRILQSAKFAFVA